MCGIFGYIGPKENSAEMIFDGLKTLEYRGYDSWGIALQSKGHGTKDTKQREIIVEKQVGKLPSKLNSPKLSALRSTLGIGHTRWATHGGVTVTNAHPHTDCTGQIAVIHNGIVENFQELKEELIQKGHKFVSETDTEVIAHLLEESIKSIKSTKGIKSLQENSSETPDTLDTSDTFTQAMRETFNRLHGLNAIVALNTSSNEIVAAKNGSPLLVGISDTPGEYFLASDATGIIKHTKKVIFLEDNQMVSLKSSAFGTPFNKGGKGGFHAPTLFPA